MSVGDLRAFARDRYQPSRMTLVLSGAIAPDWDARFMSMLPPSLRGDAAAPRAPDRRGAFPSSPPVSADASLDRRTSKAPWSELRIAWWLPGVRAVDQGPYDILANIVEGSLRSAIGKDELKNATRATAFPVFGQHGSYLMLILRLRDAGPAASEATRDAVLEVVTSKTYYHSAVTRGDPGRRARMAGGPGVDDVGRLRAPAALDAVPALLGSVEASDLARALRACQASAVVSVIGASVP